MFLLPLLLSVLTLLAFTQNLTSAQLEYQENDAQGIEELLDNGAISNLRQLSAIESLFGQVAKTVVYGGATFLRINSRILCPLLAHETRPDDTEQPTLFIFNNPENKEQAYRIYADDDITPAMIKEANFDPDQMTVILVHGWLGGIDNEFWLNRAKDVALDQRQSNSNDDQKETNYSGVGRGNKRKSDSDLSGEGNHQQGVKEFRPNVIVVDWSKFADGSLYTATKNSLKVARRLSRLLAQLASVGQLKPELMHCLGHSIGAHICGRAARDAFPAKPRLANIRTPLQVSEAAKHRFGRITGLDPGGFCYEMGVKNETTYLGMKPSDALLVDAYYSNRTPWGNRYQVAHYNVYLNNGFTQRPCSVWRNPEFAREYFRSALKVLTGDTTRTDVVVCTHYFATRFAHQILAPGCTYVAYACDSYRNFLRGQCGLCDSAAQCYSMEFEYQRPQPSIRNALERIANYSSLLGSLEDGDGPDSASGPIGGVPYANRRTYYMRTSDEEPYCNNNFRIRVLLDRDQINSTQIFSSDWIKLRLIGSQEEVVSVRDASSGKMVDTINLHGPWTSGSVRTMYEYKQVYGVDDRTLTALIELAPSVTISQAPDGSFLQPPITDVVVIYDSDNNRRSLNWNPIESVKLDYLSSSDKRIRSQNSRSFAGQTLRVYQRNY